MEREKAGTWFNTLAGASPAGSAGSAEHSAAEDGGCRARMGAGGGAPPGSKLQSFTILKCERCKGCPRKG